jgi:hypothetical protein
MLKQENGHELSSERPHTEPSSLIAQFFASSLDALLEACSPAPK